MRVWPAIVVTVAILLCSCQDGSSPTARKSRVKKSSSQRETVTASSTSPSLSQQEIIADAEASTVHITARVGSNYAFGTGVVIDGSNGWILTNAHVISGASALTVTLPDHSQAHATVLGQAPCDDIAVLELSPNPGDLQAMELGDAAALQAGDSVTVIGFPESWQDPFSADMIPTANTGTISIARTSAEPDDSLPRYDSLIQHQAPVNHGNSGGPLVDDEGQLIGINTLVNTIGPSGPIQGQYYAISIDAIQQLLPILEAGEDVGYLGWSLLSNSADLDSQFAEVFGYPPPASDGLLAVGSEPGSPAYKHGVEAGDLIRAVDDSPVSTVAELCDVLESHGPGDVLVVDGETIGDDGTPFSWSEQIKLPQ